MRRIQTLLPTEAKELAKMVLGKYRFARARFFMRGVSRARLAADLRALGVEEGDVAIVHSSLSRIGFVENGPDGVIDALLDVLGPSGTLVMPCLFFVGTIQGTMDALGGVFDPRTCPTTIGRIPETFRRRPGVCRSIHPTHSVCALGPKARWITEGHEECSTTFGKGTPWYKMMEADGKILGLGVNLGPVTFYHVIEDVITNFPVNVHEEREHIVRVIDSNLNERVMRIKAHNQEVARTRIEKNRWIRDYFTRYLTHRGVLRTGFVGRANSWMIRATDLFNCQRELLQKNVTIYTTANRSLDEERINLQR